MKYLVFILSVIVILTACAEKDPKVFRYPDPVMKHTDVDQNKIKIVETVYIPIYSDIYHVDARKKILLTSTMSIRNTSTEEKIFVETVEYHNSQGKLLREYIMIHF